MAIFMDDVKVGYAREERLRKKTAVAYDYEQRLTIGPGALKMTLDSRLQTLETPAGEPLSFRSTTTTGMGSPQVTSGKIEHGIMHVTTDTGAGARTSDVPYPAGALLNEGARLLLLKTGLKSGTQFSYKAFDETSLGATEMKVTVGEAQSVALLGRTAMLTPLQTVADMNGTRMNMVMYADANGELLKAVTTLVGIRLTYVACDETYARGPNGQFDPLKAVSPTSPVAIENPRQVTAATFTLAPLDANGPLVVPSLEGQKVRRAADGTLIVEVRLVEPRPAALKPYEGLDKEVRMSLQPSAYVESDNPEIVAAARRIVGDKTDAVQVARAIERWTSRRISGKTLAMGYSSAVTTLHTRKGDCKEHAVLTAALCRAAGIPCRVITGIAYTPKFGDLEQRFIGHAWNQAYVGGHWIMLDAALGPDAARIALLAGAEDPASFIALLQSLGNIRITAVEVGATADTDPAAEAGAAADTHPAVKAGPAADTRPVAEAGAAGPARPVEQ
jgi:hypothetical protein